MMNYIIKELEQSDFDQYDGYYETLSNLTEAPSLENEKSKEIIREINRRDGHVFIVAVEGKTIVSSVTILVEKKFIRGGAWAAHIEDVCTHHDFLGHHFALKLVKKGIAYAKERGCYKISLHCTPEMEMYYRKNDLDVKGISMEIRA